MRPLREIKTREPRLRAGGVCPRMRRVNPIDSLPPASPGKKPLERGYRLFSPRQWLFIAAAFALMGLFSGLNFLFGIFLNPLIDEFGWSRSTASAAYSINMCMIAFCSMIAGGLSDRFGTRPVLLAGVLIAGGSLLLSFFISNLWQYFLLAGAMSGLGRAAIATPVQAFIQRGLTRNRGLATGLAGSGAGLGILALAPLTGFLVSAHGWRASYLFLGVLFLAVAVPAALVLRPAKRREAEGEARRRPAAPEEPAPILPEASMGMREILRRRPFWMILASHATDCMCHSVLIVHLAPIAIEAGVSPARASGLVGLLGLGTLIGRIGAGVLADRIGAKRALLAALLTQTLPVPLLFWIGSPAAFYAVALMVGFGLGGHGTMYPVVTREYYGPRRVGALFGAFITGASSGMATGGFMGGLLHDLTGDYRLSILFSFAAGVASLLFVLSYPSRESAAKKDAARALAQPAGGGA